MSRDAIAGAPPAEGEVVPLRNPEHAVALEHFVSDSGPRETSWRDLIRRLAKNPAKR